MEPQDIEALAKDHPFHGQPYQLFGLNCQGTVFDCMSRLQRSQQLKEFNLDFPISTGIKLLMWLSALEARAGPWNVISKYFKLALPTLSFIFLAAFPASMFVNYFFLKEYLFPAFHQFVRLLWFVQIVLKNGCLTAGPPAFTPDLAGMNDSEIVQVLRCAVSRKSKMIPFVVFVFFFAAVSGGTGIRADASSVLVSLQSFTYTSELVPSSLTSWTVRPRFTVNYKWTVNETVRSAMHVIDAQKQNDVVFPADTDRELDGPIALGSAIYVTVNVMDVSCKNLASQIGDFDFEYRYLSEGSSESLVLTLKSRGSTFRSKMTISVSPQFKASNNVSANLSRHLPHEKKVARWQICLGSASCLAILVVLVVGMIGRAKVNALLTRQSLRRLNVQGPKEEADKGGKTTMTQTMELERNLTTVERKRKQPCPDSNDDSGIDDEDDCTFSEMTMGIVNRVLANMTVYRSTSHSMS
ncbi:hypothetical protein BV898_02685 [Hypsibius exemplaris]|uniref:Uncharacterized protein n=1 Tax=Hypsibius exemplaris TaxID=2072580 RepID=A0A1W0X7R1_HYPEX|nr:hypothetical protein BV898_02685 [Hypsibius exemplaris]